MTLKYRFEVTYQTPQMKQVSDFMNKCDLNIGNICCTETIMFEYTREEKPVQYFKDLITQAMNQLEYTVFKIEGGKVE